MKALLEVIKFNANDVITASGKDDSGSTYCPCDGPQDCPFNE